MPLQTVIPEPIKLAEDFDEVSLTENPKARVLSRGVSTITEYSDSSFSSSSSSSRSSTNTDDDYDIKLDLNFAATAAGNAIRSPSSSNRSSVTSKSDEDESVATPNTVSSEFDDPDHPQFTITANKLNGYAINTLKSKSSISLLNPNQASAKSRHDIAREPTQLFVVPDTGASPLPSPSSSFPASRSFPTRSRSLLNNPPATLVSSPSLRVQSSQASQGLRIKPFVSKVPLTETASEETDSFTPLPQKRIHRAASTPKFTPDLRPRIRRSASAKALNTNTSLALPTTKQGLTPQQRLRLRRQNSTSKLTTAQLELQCDSDDGDDDIPGDTLVWNVPLSPALYAKTQQASPSKSAPQPSPLGPSKSKTKRERTQEGLSSINESEPTQYFSTPGLEDLSEDARNLTRAFQDMPSAKSMEQAYTKQHEQPSIKLPPKRRSNDFMDPVPMSKEKEAALSRTRPSWLPPKSQEEEARHLYEYKQMMALASAAEKKRESKKKLEQAARLKLRAKEEQEWKTSVLPRFERAVQEPRTRELWWKGIPTRYRAIIWKARAGNTLGITKSTYEKALQRGKEMQAKVNAGEANSRYKPMLDALARDSCNALPEIGLFGPHGPMHEQLSDILIAFAFYRPDIGYKYGLHLLAATLLLNLTPLESFIALAGMLNHSLCQALFMHDERTLTSYYTSFLKVLNTKLPTLYEHFKSIRLPPSAYLEPMLTSLYAGHTDADVTSRIWDIMFFEGDSFLLRVALGVLMKCEHKLYGNAEEVLSILGWNAPKLDLGATEDGGDEFMALVRSALKANAA